MVDDHGVGIAEGVLAYVPLRRPREHVTRHPAGLRHAAQPQVGGHRDQHRQDVPLGLRRLGQLPPARVGEAVQEPRPGVELDQQRGDRRERQHPGQLVLQLPGLRRDVLGRQRRHHQVAVAVQADRPAVTGRGTGEGRLQLGQRCVQFLLSLLQGARGGRGLADQPAVLLLPGRPLPGRVQVGRRVGVPPRPGHEHIAGAQPVPQAQGHAQLPVVPVRGVLPALAGLLQVVGVPGRHEPGRRARGDLPAAEPVHLLQDGHGRHQLRGARAALEIDHGQHVRGELPQVGVGGVQLRQPAVVLRQRLP